MTKLTQFFESLEDVDDLEGDVSSFDKPTDYNSIARAFFNNRAHKISNAVQAVCKQFSCTPEEVALAVEETWDEEMPRYYNTWKPSKDYISQIRQVLNLNESVEEEDFGDVSSYEKPGWRAYIVDYVLYGENKYYHASFAAPDDTRALEIVVEEFTGQSFKEAAEERDTSDAREILEGFSNSDMDIIEIYPIEGDTVLFRGNGSFDEATDEEGSIIDEDWDTNEEG